VRRDSIDILVILAGRFDTNRFLFARHRAAPVQVSIHDVATSALPFMDYFIGDPAIVPRTLDPFFTERVLRLPSFYIREPAASAPDVSPLPLLASGQVTFGCFGKPMKINRRVLDLWARLLLEVPDARLRLKFLDRYRSADVRARMLTPFTERGIAPARVVFMEHAQDANEHLDAYTGVDIALDPFPFAGSTTSFEALFMGVPVVTRPGDMPVSRWTSSMLRVLNLDDFIATSEEDYLRIAVEWARTPTRLAELRTSLRKRVVGSPLCDGRLRARQFGRLFEAMWRRQIAA
jgi:predicted O-linked N-acetylglucosamine transferase (SPINDLY family)